MTKMLKFLKYFMVLELDVDKFFSSLADWLKKPLVMDWGH
jgi:hypothetical protein